MSFSSEVKHEIATRDLNDEGIRAQLSAFMHLNATLHIRNRNMELQIEIQNPTIAKRIFSLLKERYEVEIDLTVLKCNHFNKANIYRLRVLEKGISILEDLGIYSSRGLREVPYSVIVVKEASAQAYLAGAFLASGSVNAPSRPNYHLEVGANTEKMALFIQGLIKRFGLDAKITKRRDKPIVYIKSADQIADFLKIVGAYNKTMEFEDIRIQRDFRNSLTRLDNIELANEVKTQKAANTQIDAIIKLMEHNRYSHIDARLVEVAELRMKHPEYSLNELIDEYIETTGNRISKSGMQHRFNKIIELADKIKG
jgi:cell division protein WhiA